MPSRMDRYDENNNAVRMSRSQKNQELYQNIGKNTRYTNIDEVTNSNAYEIDNTDENVTTREKYLKLKEYREIEPITKERKELADINYLYQDRDNKIYDVNRVLEEARKNREISTEEDKRKLKDDSFNIIASLTPEELENYRKERTARKPVEDEAELRDLIDTITSKTLAGEIDKATSVNLLSDLMATNAMDSVEAAKEPEEDKELELSKEVLDKEQLEKIRQVKDKEVSDTGEATDLSNADDDFYTRSMDLSDKDFEMTDDFVEEKTSVLFKIVAVLIFIAAIAAAGYFIWQNLK